LQKLYSDGTLILNDRNIEKVHVYLERDKVLKAAGIDLNLISVKERLKISKRFKRRQINQNESIQALQREITEEMQDDPGIQFGFEPVDFTLLNNKEIDGEIEEGKDFSKSLNRSTK